MSACRNCGQPILWARTERGNRMPLDAEPIADPRLEHGPVFVLRDRHSAEGPLAISAWGLEGTEPHHRAHFDTCTAKQAA